MKILIISKIFPNHLSPMFGTFVFNETRALAQEHEVQVLAPIPWFPRLPVFKRWSQFAFIAPTEKIGGLPVAHPRYVVFPKIGRSLYGLNYILGIRRAVNQIHKTSGFDAILAHYAYPDGYAAAYFARKFGCPLLLKTHGSDIHEDVRYRSRRFGVVKALRRADRIIPVSQSLKKQIEALRIPPAKIQVIHNGIDTQHFNVRNQAACRAELGLAPDEKILLFVGQLVPVKGVLSLIQLFQKYIQQHGPQLRLVLVGGGELEKAVRQQIKAVNLEKQVTLAGPQHHDQIPKWMNAADILCLNSLNEGYPTVLIEAQACGLPIIATDVGGVREIIQNQNLERLIAPGDTAGFLTGLQELYQQIERNQKNRISRYSRTWDDVANDITRILQELVKHKTK